MLIRLIFSVVAAITFAASGIAQQIVNPDGGADISYLVIEASVFGDPLYYGYRYTLDEGSPLDGYALAEAIAALDTDLEFGWTNFGDDEFPNYYLNSITFDGVTVAAEPWPGSYWAQWVSGGEAGYPEAAPIAAGQWTFGFGSSAPARFHANGSTDGYVFGDGSNAPSITPVPEPSVWLLALFGMVVAWFFVRRQRV